MASWNSEWAFTEVEGSYGIYVSWEKGSSEVEVGDGECAQA